ncbi:PREDICTED: aspartic proteinase CDR1-like [Ipomoea nil]|uniref:aspartic proteinase CDR1-like n=1 Tax=Ipomoea nil TaxID=35883 RepID=UPI000900E7E6|nr:PREDICTED: aspartic proteinase CDR1-like [Ipomoea nil]
MKYSIGTPPFETYGIADTGSDITWTQCKPCTSCFDQSLPLFDPKDSSSYALVSCDSDTCSSSQSFGCGTDDECQYEVTYGDQSSTVGDLAIDTLTLGNTSFKSVLFGCGHENSGTFSSDTSGIVGLGGDGATSIIYQLDKKIGGKFAYCLSPDANSTSHISFGPDAVVRGTGAVSTPLIKKAEQATFYWLNLERLSVGGKSLTVKSPSVSISGRRAGGIKQASVEGNIIIDSGTTLTYLPSDLYTSFESAVKDAISATPVSDSSGLFPLCYSSDSLEVPTIIAHFTGADVELSPKGTFVEVEEGLVCLTLIPNTNLGADLAIFGNLSETDYIVAYDLVAKTVTFKPSDCSKF